MSANFQVVRSGANSCGLRPTSVLRQTRRPPHQELKRAERGVAIACNSAHALLCSEMTIDLGLDRRMLGFSLVVSIALGN
jgi:hypothetical protein